MIDKSHFHAKSSHVFTEGGGGDHVTDFHSDRSAADFHHFYQNALFKTDDEIVAFLYDGEQQRPFPYPKNMYFDIQGDSSYPHFAEFNGKTRQSHEGGQPPKTQSFKDLTSHMKDTIMLLGFHGDGKDWDKDIFPDHLKKDWCAHHPHHPHHPHLR